nr:MAG TPA: hypothetical protein [Bacteriophage sp.]
MLVFMYIMYFVAFGQLYEINLKRSLLRLLSLILLFS